MQFTTGDSQPAAQERSDYINPPDMINHLLLIWPVMYEQDTYTKYPRQDGRPSDAVYVDVVDLSMNGEDGQPGLVMRHAKWTQGRLIRDTKGHVGIPRDMPMLKQMTKDGDAYQLIEQAHNPGSVQMAEWWMNAHPQFQPGENAVQATAAPAPPQTANSGQSTVLERLRTQATRNETARPVPAGPQPPLPPPPPIPGFGDGEPPF
jgi:hypothetical protein